jgi:hypothetical protein
LLIEQHGDEAHEIAIKRAANLGGQGAKLAALGWLQVAIAVRMLEKGRPRLSLVQ